jgi:hypothetical protein
VGNLLLTLAGFVAAVVGIGINWGLGSALLIGGVVLFVAGGLAAAQERKKP